MNTFVFVVCGGKEFISELNLSIKFLRHFSKYPIVVLTDTSRNEIAIDHDDIIDIKTPSYLGNHQAHLYLETKLPHYVNGNPEDIFCYLDSDIIAINDSINNIFDHFNAPIVFARDHCNIDYFSPGVMYCDCIGYYKAMEDQFHFMQTYFPVIPAKENAIKGNNELTDFFIRIKKNPFANKFEGLKYFLRRYIFRKNNLTAGNSYIFNFDDHCWYNREGNIIHYDYNYYIKRLWKTKRIKIKNNKWLNNKGEELIPQAPNCSHLRQHIKRFYGIDIPPGWQHWNGGVFLFNNSSIVFFNKWHEYTMKEINRGKIKPYDDQGTLAVCAWEFELQNNKTIPVKYNFITDFGNKNVRFSTEKGFTYNNFKTIFNPSFIHVYNQWGNKEWDIWQAVTEIGIKNKII